MNKRLKGEKWKVFKALKDFQGWFIIFLRKAFNTPVKSSAWQIITFNNFNEFSRLKNFAIFQSLRNNKKKFLARFKDVNFAEAVNIWVRGILKWCDRNKIESFWNFCVILSWLWNSQTKFVINFHLDGSLI